MTGGHLPPYFPGSSWWVGVDRETFTTILRAEHAERMRRSLFGRMQQITLGPSKKPMVPKRPKTETGDEG